MAKKKRTSNVLSYLIIIAFILGGYLFITLPSKGQHQEPISDSVKSELTVEFIDVGQGDSILIMTPNKKTILIDAGESGNYEKIKDTLYKYNINKIDAVIATHPHADHIGGMEQIIRNFEIGKIYMPDKIHTSKTFENLLLAIEEKGLEIDIAEAGVKMDLDEALNLTFVSPNGDFADLNNTSAVLRLIYKDTSFLFTGDMEAKAEKLIDANIDVDVLKVGHHGSDTSSSKEFLDKASPQIAVISVGKDNKYNHPSSEVIKRLNNIGAKILRTDESGNITITSDGVNLDIKTER